MAKVTKEEIEQFLSGTDPMEHIIKIEGDYDDDHMTIIFRGEDGKLKKQNDKFYPFVWCKQSAARQLFNGNREILKNKMAHYGITCKGLRIADDEGNIHPRMENGYRVMFYAKFSMSYKKFMDFFKEGGRPIYPSQGDANYGLREYITVSPIEQYMISTGKRLFKGYDDYDELIRMSWDLETEGLNPQKDAISQIGIRTNKGFEKIITIEGQGEEKLKNEMKGLKEFFEILYTLKPDVIVGYNTENFDWYFIDERLKLRGSSLLDYTKELFYGRGIYKKKKQQVLKLGGEMEYYYPTIMWGHNIVDALFAVRRAQAIDSNMKKATLKYICAYSKMNKPNRVYVPGKEINSTWEDTTPSYAFNDEDGEWFKIDDKRMNKTYDDDNGNSHQLYTLNEKSLINNKTGKTYIITTGRYIIERYLLDDLWETDKVENRYNQPNFLVGKMLPVSYEKMCTMGTAAIWKYIMMAWSYQHNLAIPELIETKKFTGGLSRLLKVGYVDRIVKLDYNSLYPSIILTYGIKSPIDITGVMNALLEYILTQREHYKGLKAQYGKEVDKLKERLKDVTDEDELKKIKEKITLFSSKKSMADKMQLPLKVVGNGFFGSYGSGSVFPWSDLECAEETTCRGRQMLRLMISHFSTLGNFNTDTPNDEYNYHPIVGDTDGFNFQKPLKYRYTKEHPYIGKGLGRNVIKGKEYTEVDADVAEFEDTFINEAYRGGVLKNGLGIDEYCDACIQFSRKNYADLMPDGSMKLVGNTIKSKKMPIYIEKFLNKAIEMLLHGRGDGFLNYYYDYIEKIYNMQIPLKDIATVGKIKTSIEDYKENCRQLTAGGTKKARQAWYELAIRDNISVNMGDTIYYINTGSKKASSDVQRVTRYYYIDKNGKEIDFATNEDGSPKTDRKGNIVPLNKSLESEYEKLKKLNDPMVLSNDKGNKAKKYISKDDFIHKKYPQIKDSDVVIFNCVRLPNEIVEDEEDHFCNDELEYNREKYIDMFNKRIKPLLVCFDSIIRNTTNEKGKIVNNILITNPRDRKEFTFNESRLVAGQPYESIDQDTYEQLMTIEDKEIKFWINSNMEPPYTKECGIDWENIKKDYLERQNELKKEGIRQEKEIYDNIINHLTSEDVNKVLEEGILPDKLLKLINEDVNDGNFYSKKFKIKIGNIYDIVEKDFSKSEIDDTESTNI